MPVPLRSLHHGLVRPARTVPRATACALAVLALSPGAPLSAQEDAKAFVVAHVEADEATWAETARRIWELAEVGYQEHESSALLQTHLREGGFRVEAGVAGIPTAFVAEWGSGEPVVAILAEFDALPGITQDDSPERSPRADRNAGHACGHHLFGTGSVAAARAVKAWLESSGTAGTIRLYGTPAEEGGAGKVYMVRDGLFEDVDAVLHWHADDENNASPSTSLANKSAKFRFHGVSAHAAGAPERGRSALDGVEAMNVMVNMMREHVPEATRIHYVITSGGAAPNVIPDFAEVFYYVRHPESETVAELFERVVAAAEGAALGTGTTVEHEIIHGIYSLLPNEVLARVMDANLQAVGGVTYTDEEAAFASVVQRSFDGRVPALEQAGRVQPYELRRGGGSTDVGDVSWVVPTAGMRAATWVPGTAAHSWQAVAAGGTTIGAKGMMVAAKTLARTAVDLFLDPSLAQRAEAERRERVGPDYVYRALVGDRDPPLDYRSTGG